MEITVGVAYCADVILSDLEFTVSYSDAISLKTVDNTFRCDSKGSWQRFGLPFGGEDMTLQSFDRIRIPYCISFCYTCSYCGVSMFDDHKCKVCCEVGLERG